MAPETARGVSLYLIRHGETVVNAERRLQGSRMDSALTVRGRDQARGIAAILGAIVAPEAPPRFVCSPLGRARATMEIILEELALPPAYATDALLSEIDVGAWSGRLGLEIRANDRERFEARARDKWNHPCPGGESLAMVARRAQAFLDALDRDTVAVSHGTFGRVLRAVYAGAGERGMDGLDEPQDCIFRLSGGEIARIGPAGR